jgi:hypothetical protein
MSDWVSSICNSVRSKMHSFFSIQDVLRLEFLSEEVRRLVQQRKQTIMGSKWLKTQRGRLEMAGYLKELSYART